MQSEYIDQYIWAKNLVPVCYYDISKQNFSIQMSFLVAMRLRTIM